ncbi:rhamnose-binding lectin-like [Sebastes umbrosus]|uniref:rhamnose-binding lectin-like n=1 Tax=Sebastes umbrosus TaxID=72105 RepID=UPI0018A125B7|nr:rhamnose-binding lectin-like [Sebastes umbrosus]
MLRLSTTLLLAATCLLVRPGVAIETTTTCEPRTVHRLSCDSGVVIVEEVLYGRADSLTCGAGRPPGQLANTQCSLEGALSAVKTRCDGKRVCEINRDVFGATDPCVGTFKYLQTKYNCLPAIHLVTCEHSLAHLHCDVGQVISVFGADYGRRDQTTCIYKRPASQFLKVDCSNPTSSVSDSCGGKNSCSFSASNSVFGDPCPGTFKYLEIAYVCEYPTTIQEDTKELFTWQMNTGVSAINQPTAHLRPHLSSETMPCFRLSTTLLLAAVCSLMAAVASKERVVTCGSLRNVHHLTCGHGVIRVQAAEYGRKDNMTCSVRRPRRQLANTKCSQAGTVNVLKSRCDGKKECDLNINVVRNPDPCRGIYKYLETIFACFPAIHFSTCEGSVANLQCAEGQIISVYGAHYGRTDQTTCTYKLPSSQIQKINCARSVTGPVSKSCNGKNSCAIEVGNSKLGGDPCGGIYKYLEVAYICEYPIS